MEKVVIVQWNWWPMNLKGLVKLMFIFLTEHIRASKLWNLERVCVILAELFGKSKFKKQSINYIG